MKKNGIMALSLALLLALPAFAVLAPAAFAEEPTDNIQSLQVQTEPLWNNVWYKFETPLITLIFPAKGTKPMFLWWYTNDNSTIYVVKFQGVMEYLIFDKPYYLKRFQADNSTINATLWKDRIEPKLRFRYGHGGWWYNQTVMEFLGLLRGLHRAYLPFNACNWTLTGPELIVDGNSSYYSFNFTLTEVYGHPWLEFAENNIEIRCRFYNATTTEVPDENCPEYNYTVAAGQLKFDFVVSNWQWNIDKINNFLRKYNIDREIPENRTGLALWVNMASIKIEDLTYAANEVQSQVETRSQTRGVMVGDQYYDVRNNETDQDEKPMLQLRERFRERVRIQFAQGGQNLSGFLDFVPWARLLDENGITVDYVDVTASYIAAGAHLRLFICYPYFGNYTLEHDPTIGLASAPQLPTLAKRIMLLILIGATIAIAVAVAAVKFRKPTVNIVNA